MPTLFWSAPSGEANQQIQTFNAAQGSTRMVAVPVPQADVLPNGQFASQPLAWDGTSWVPVGFPGVPGELVFRIWLSAPSPFGVEPYALFTCDSTVGPPVASMQSVDVLNFPGSDWRLQGEHAQLSVGSSQFGFRALYTAEPANSIGHRWDLEESGVPQTVLQFALNGALAGIGAFGATPVPQQSITGTSLQEQVDSIVSAMVNFGYFVDNRTANTSQGQLAWNLVGARVLTLLPAGHPPGLYLVTATLYVRTAAGSGDLNGSTFSWSEPGVGAPVTLALPAINPQVTGLVATFVRAVLSSGVSALTYTITPNAITGAPIADLSAGATLITGPVV